MVAFAGQPGTPVSRACSGSPLRGPAPVEPGQDSSCPSRSSQPMVSNTLSATRDLPEAAHQFSRKRPPVPVAAPTPPEPPPTRECLECIFSLPSCDRRGIRAAIRRGMISKEAIWRGERRPRRLNSILHARKFPARRQSTATRRGACTDKLSESRRLAPIATGVIRASGRSGPRI